MMMARKQSSPMKASVTGRRPQYSAQRGNRYPPQTDGGDRWPADPVAYLVGRRWELSTVEGLLDRAIDGHGAVVGVVGSPGIGKSRLVREVAAIARRCDVEVFTTYCESHATDVPFRVVARLLRTVAQVSGLDDQAARARLRERFPDADQEDMLLLDDLLGIADPDVELPKIDPDARRRRLTALVNGASLARRAATVYVIEDAHWIDEVSESMIAEFLTVIPQTPSLVLVNLPPRISGCVDPSGRCPHRCPCAAE
jgi:predicted ATPase